MSLFFADALFSVLQRRYDSDLNDQWNYYYTTVLLIVFALTTSAKQYVGAPLQCWAPAQFSGVWESYAENYCFAQNTYFLPFSRDVPKAYQERRDAEIPYYQWVPFVLIAQALMFYIPIVIWRTLNWQSGINVKGVIGAFAGTNLVKSLDDAQYKAISAHLADTLELQRKLKRSTKGNFCGLIMYGSKNGVYITGLYIAVKLMFVINVILQFLIMNSFLGFPHYSFWGFGVLNDVRQGREWEVSGNFPRVTMCDFQVMDKGALRHYVIQCVLMINMFNEKIFIFLYFLFFILAILNILNAICWCLDMFTSRSFEFIARYIRVYEKYENVDERKLQRFVQQFLRPDGVFIIHMISLNFGDLHATHIVIDLWDAWIKDNYEGYIIGDMSGQPETGGESQGLLEDMNNND